MVRTPMLRPRSVVYGDLGPAPRLLSPAYDELPCPSNRCACLGPTRNPCCHRPPSSCTTANKHSLSRLAMACLASLHSAHRASKVSAVGLVRCIDALFSLYLQ